MLQQVLLLASGGAMIGILPFMFATYWIFARVRVITRSCLQLLLSDPCDALRRDGSNPWLSCQSTTRTGNQSRFTRRWTLP